MISASMFSLSIEANESYPDSTRMDFQHPISINHTINGSKIGSNPLIRTDYGSWSPWETSSHMTSCTPWMPHSDTVLWGEQFIQTKLCNAEETRERTISYFYANGTIFTEMDYETVSTQVDDEQYGTGTKNYILSTTPSYGNWINVGSKHSCSSWSPSASTVKKGTEFNQNRSCKQNQERQVTYYNNWADGSKTVKNTDKENKTITISDSRKAIGTKNNAKWHGIFNGYTFSYSTTLPKGVLKFKTEINADGSKANEFDASKSFSNKRYVGTDDNFGMGDECEFEAKAYGYLSYNASSRKLTFVGDNDEKHCPPDGFASPEVGLRDVKAYY